jgi:tetratricopeptide (TPR) repeat protein
MTMRLPVLALSVLLIGAAGASAQKVPVPTAPAIRVAPAVPAAPAVPLVPDLHFDFQDLHDFHVDLPEFHIDVPEFLIDLPHFDFDLNQEPFLIAGQNKGVPVTGPFFAYQEQSQIENQYSQARNRIDSNQYDRALEPLDRVISAKGERADGALYWKAYSLMKLARRDEALSTVAQLTKQFPDSPWVRDARALEVEIKQAAGQNAATDAVDDETKLLALQGLMRTSPDSALPAVEKMLAGSSSVRLKDRALFVLSQSRSDKAIAMIGNIARTNPNPDLKQKAIRYLGVSNTAEAINTLLAVYRGDNSVETKKAVISSLASSSQNQAAVTALITLGRAERNPELRASIVRHVSNSNSPEVKPFLEEILLK